MRDAGTERAFVPGTHLHSRPMTPVTPIEPRLRRPDVSRRPRLAELDVAIPVHREPATTRRVEPRERPLSEMALAARFFPLVAVVVAADLATKAWAATSLAARTVRLLPALSLSLHFNPASAGGVWLGEETRALNFTATGIVVGVLVMIAPQLVRVDRKSWVALALIVGAGLGNLVSLARGERGVVDFIALHHGAGAWVLNVADVALAIGLALLARTTLVMLRSARSGGSRVRMR
jgi:lipoprotein signal peptidase